MYLQSACFDDTTDKIFQIPHQGQTKDDTQAFYYILHRHEKTNDTTVWLGRRHHHRKQLLQVLS